MLTSSTKTATCAHYLKIIGNHQSILKMFRLMIKLRQTLPNIIMERGKTLVVSIAWTLTYFLIADLSECQLMQVPDAVYHLMRHTELKSCDLSGNVITKIPPKFAVKFSLITDLNLSHNQMSKLPDEIKDLGSLLRLDLSHNTFISLPTAVFKIPKLQQMNASNNHIVGKSRK